MKCRFVNMDPTVFQVESVIQKHKDGLLEKRYHYNMGVIMGKPHLKNSNKNLNDCFRNDR